MLSPLAEPKGEGVSSTEVLWALPRPDGALQDQPGPESGLAAALAPLPMKPGNSVLSGQAAQPEGLAGTVDSGAPGGLPCCITALS